MQSANDLKNLLQAIHRKGYPAYKETKGSYRFASYVLTIEHVQGDPFASPSQVSLLLPGKTAGFPSKLYNTDYKRTALQDHILRLFSRQVERFSHQAKGSGKSGLIATSRPGQEILSRTACELHPENGDIRIRLHIGFPANGRSINSQELIKIFFEFLPLCAERTLFYQNIDPKALEQAIHLSVNQNAVRRQLAEQNLIAFVANGSVLPRESGVSQRPLKNAVPFRSPTSMEVTLELPFGGPITGMGIKKGVTLIIGGGYHGKSTLLKALELGVYNHVAGDGREYVITDEQAVKIRAEDGRSIKGTDISMFINHLPNRKDTRQFYTEDASGSTSQAANVIEAMEAGCSLFLIDEDTCATNFMIRDELMQRVVSKDREPITPFIFRAREIYEKAGISSVLVAGSSGSYFHIADTILQMDEYQPKEVTKEAKKEAQNFPLVFPEDTFPAPGFHRMPEKNRALGKDDRIKIKPLGKDAFLINRENVDLRYVEQLVDEEQLNALSYILLYAERFVFDGKKELKAAVNEIIQVIETKGMAALSDRPYLPASLALPRKQEIFACINRYRGL